MNYTNPGDHATKIYINNRTFKERYHVQYHRITFHSIPKFIIRYLDFYVVRKLIFSKSKDVCHHILSPKLLWIRNLCNITNISQFHLENLSKQIMTTIRYIQIFYEQLMEIFYDN